jgi:hypothetical protein
VLSQPSLEVNLCLAAVREKPPCTRTQPLLLQNSLASSVCASFRSRSVSHPLTPSRSPGGPKRACCTVCMHAACMWNKCACVSACMRHAHPIQGVMLRKTARLVCSIRGVCVRTLSSHETSHCVHRRYTRTRALISVNGVRP